MTNEEQIAYDLAVENHERAMARLSELESLLAERDDAIKEWSALAIQRGEERDILQKKLDRFYSQSHGIPALSEIEKLRALLASEHADHICDIEEMVNRFLSWPLPDDVCADPCASIPGYANRTGTNLLNANQAKTMLAHVLGDHSAHGLNMVEQPSAGPANPSIESVLLWLNYYVSGKFNTDDRGARDALNILCAAFAVDLSSTQAGGE